MVINNRSFCYKSINEKTIDFIAELEKQIEMQNAKLKDQEEIKLLAEQIIHDIRSPLLALSVFIKSCQGLSKKDRSFLKSAINSMENITKSLCSKCNVD